MGEAYQCPVCQQFYGKHGGHLCQAPHPCDAKATVDPASLEMEKLNLADGGMGAIHQSIQREARYLSPPGMGITLREYFAAAALQGLRANERGVGYSKEMVARLAWSDADAMLAHVATPQGSGR